MYAYRVIGLTFPSSFLTSLLKKQEHTVFVNRLLASAVRKLKWTRFKKVICNLFGRKQTSTPQFSNVTTVFLWEGAQVRAAVPWSLIIQGSLGGHRGYQLIKAPKFATSLFANRASLALKHFYCSDCEPPSNRCYLLGRAGPGAPAWRWPARGLWPRALQLPWSLHFCHGAEVSTKSATLKKRSIAATTQSLLWAAQGTEAVASLCCRRAWPCSASNPRASRAQWGPPHCLKSSVAPTWSVTGPNTYRRLRCAGYCIPETWQAGAGTREWRQLSDSCAWLACRDPVRRSCPATEENIWRGCLVKESTVQAAGSCFRKCFRRNLRDKVRKMSVCSHLYGVLQVTAFSLYHTTKRDGDFYHQAMQLKV